jgi:hypothetical protein
MEKYCRARHAVDDNIIRRMRFACWITKATDTEYVTHFFSTATMVTRKWRYSTLPLLSKLKTFNNLPNVNNSYLSVLFFMIIKHNFFQPEIMVL